MESYNLIAQNYAQVRQHSTIGLAELGDVLSRLPKGALVLDFGAGTGLPLTKQIVRHPHQFKVFAVDSSLGMVNIFRENFPTIPVQCASILDFNFFGETFDAVVAWGVMFHLTEEEQHEAIRTIASRLNRQGYFLFTSAKESGTRTGTMYGEEFHYASLGAEEYQKCLVKHGFMLLDEHFDIGQNYYYLAQKTLSH